jgi:hypothetical protein
MSIPGRAYNILRGYIHREWERIQGVEWDTAEKELDESLEKPRIRPDKPVQIVDEPDKARKILGVSQKAKFGEVRKAYEKLLRRSDPSNFPGGSQEAREAADIHRRVIWAYSVLSEGVDVTDKRFQSLEID